MSVFLSKSIYPSIYARFSARSAGLRVASVGAAELRDGRGGAVRRERRLVQR